MNRKTAKKRRIKALQMAKHNIAVQFYESLRAKGVKDPEAQVKALINDLGKNCYE